MRRSSRATPSSRPAASAPDYVDCAVTALYHEHYASLVRLAAFLVCDRVTAEEIVQDSFVAVHAAWRRRPDPDRALCYLRQAVLSRSRSVPRRRSIVKGNSSGPAPDLPDAEQQAAGAPEFPAIMSALHALPARQREVLVMRYYASLSEAQTAKAMGISEDAVRRHAARATAALRGVMDAT